MAPVCKQQFTNLHLVIYFEQENVYEITFLIINVAIRFLLSINAS